MKFDSRRIEYSDRYEDDKYEYRHVVLPHETLEERTFVKELIAMDRFLSEKEWRMIGIEQSSGWCHYGFFAGEPFVMLFRRLPREFE